MNLTEKLLWHIEANLSRPTNLAEMAKACAASPYHMARSFQRTTGISPMAYLRARRLSVAAQALAMGRDTVLSIALDAQYSSHEAFTRAFHTYFGVLPKTVRDARSLDGLTLQEPLRMSDFTLVPVEPHKIATRPAFSVTALVLNCTLDDLSGVTPLWNRLGGYMDQISPTGPAFGICTDMTESGQFKYAAGLQTAPDASVPADMERVDVPENTYAVFTFNGHIGDISNWVHSVWNKALPDAGLEPKMDPDFELYDDRFDVESGRGIVELWIPVEQ